MTAEWMNEVRAALAQDAAAGRSVAVWTLLAALITVIAAKRILSLEERRFLEDLVREADR